MTTNGEHDNDITVSESPGARIRRLAERQRVFAENLLAAGRLVDSLTGEHRARLLDDIAAESGELGDAYHDLRRGLKNL